MKRPIRSGQPRWAIRSKKTGSLMYSQHDGVRKVCAWRSREKAVRFLKSLWRVDGPERYEVIER